MSGEAERADIPNLAWQTVTCTRCEKTYQCTPWEDFHDPAEWMEWEKGGVCYNCLLFLALRYQDRHGRLPNGQKLTVTPKQAAKPGFQIYDGLPGQQ